MATRNALVRLPVRGRASISAIISTIDILRAAAISDKAAQKLGSSEMLVACPAMVIERLVGFSKIIARLYFGAIMSSGRTISSNSASLT